MLDWLALLLLGAVRARETSREFAAGRLRILNTWIFKKLKNAAVNIGVCASAEDLYLSMRGLRTLEMRLDYAAKNMTPILDWFANRK